MQCLSMMSSDMQDNVVMRRIQCAPHQVLADSLAGLFDLTFELLVGPAMLLLLLATAVHGRGEARLLAGGCGYDGRR